MSDLELVRCTECLCLDRLTVANGVWRRHAPAPHVDLGPARWVESRFPVVNINTNPGCFEGIRKVDVDAR